MTGEAAAKKNLYDAVTKDAPTFQLEMDAEKLLYDAATKGDVESFQQLARGNPNLLERASFASSRNLLHAAIIGKQITIVEEVLKMNEQLAQDLDSKSSSSLHIAAAKGSVETTARLLEIAPEMRWWRDCRDMNPVHIAAVNGRVDILRELLDRNVSPALERVRRGQTVLHLCVKHGRLEALGPLVEKLGELVYAEDDDGETILHLAVRCNQLETVEYLVGSYKMRNQTRNSMGKTALEILKDGPRASKHTKMETLLKISSKQSMLEVLPKLTDTTMVVVVLIATMAFQAAISPPGGVWQEHGASHRAGDSVMASTHPKIYKHFVRANTTAFVASLITIFLITTRQPSGRLHFLLVSLLAMWVSMASIAVTYGASVMVVTPNTETLSLAPVIIAVVVVTLGIIVVILVCSVVRTLSSSWKPERRHRRPKRSPFCNALMNFFSWIVRGGTLRVHRK